MSFENFSKLTVGDVVVRKVLTIDHNATVMDAVRKMAAINVGAIVIVNKEKQIEGIFSERDHLNKVTACGKDPSDAKIADVMTRAPIVLQSDTTLIETYRIMQEGNFRHAPVMENNQLIGMISIKDLNKALNSFLAGILFD